MKRNFPSLLIITVIVLILNGCAPKKPPRPYVPSTKNDITAYHPASYDYAYSYFKKGAERGDPVAQNNLGKMYADGRGVPQDAEKSVYWFTKAAHQHEADAETNLGVAYLYGRGIQKDKVQACRWFKPAKRQGNKYAAEFYSLNC